MNKGLIIFTVLVVVVVVGYNVKKRIDDKNTLG
jgi:hypothetical protein